MAPCAVVGAFVGSGHVESPVHISRRRIYLTLIEFWAIELQPLHQGLYEYISLGLSIFKTIRVYRKENEINLPGVPAGRRFFLGLPERGDAVAGDGEEKYMTVDVVVVVVVVVVDEDDDICLIYSPSDGHI
ncbi:hypothetical protein DsansV1_C02g0017541 [Dioscorea sansibarensis]